MSKSVSATTPGWAAICAGGSGCATSPTKNPRSRPKAIWARSTAPMVAIGTHRSRRSFEMKNGHGIWLSIGAAALAVAPAAMAKESAPAPIAAGTAPSAPTKAAPKTILFIGNSFTQGAHSAARNWRAETVTNLNNARYGGVPALFKLFAEQAGLDYQVSLETQGGKSLGFHYDERRQLFDRPWDIVVLQEFSTLDRAKPGDPTNYMHNVDRLAALFKARNPPADIRLASTWTRADQTYKAGGHWYGKPVTAMADDLRAAAARRRAAHPSLGGIVPVRHG